MVIIIIISYCENKLSVSILNVNYPENYFPEKQKS